MTKLKERTNTYKFSILMTDVIALLSNAITINASNGLVEKEAIDKHASEVMAGVRVMR